MSVRVTRFAGLTELDAGDPLSSDGAAFQAQNPTIIDHYLELGAKTHRHDGHPGLLDPDTEPDIAITPTPGTIPGGISVTVGFTLVDGDRGETAISPQASITMPETMSPPVSAPTAVADYSGGQLRADTYYYVKTWIDDVGGETTTGPRVAAERAPGFASGQIELSGLASGMALASAAGWRLYKSLAGGAYKFIAQGTDDTLTDDGTICADCVTPPPTTNTTSQRNSFAVTVGSALASAAASFRLYGGRGSIIDPALLGEYPLASAGAPIEFSALNLLRGRPPRISTSVGGANQIDPDTDILDWSWKRSVADAASLPSGVAADVRMTRDTHRIYTPSGATAGTPADWIEVPGNVLVVASGSSAAVKARVVVVQGGSVTPSGASAIVAVGSGGGGGGGAALAWTPIGSGGSSWGNGVSQYFQNRGARVSGIATPPPASFMRDADGWVHMRGVFEAFGIDAVGGVGFGTPICRLPSGCIPEYPVEFVVPYWDKINRQSGGNGGWMLVTLRIGNAPSLAAVTIDYGPTDPNTFEAMVRYTGMPGQNFLDPRDGDSFEITPDLCWLAHH